MVLVFFRWLVFIVKFWTNWTEQKGFFQMKKNNDKHNCKKGGQQSLFLEMFCWVKEVVSSVKAQSQRSQGKETKVATLLAIKLCTF